MKLEILEIVKNDDHMWLSLLGIEFKYFYGHLLHVEYDMGLWKWDVFWLRQLAMKIRGF